MNGVRAKNRYADDLVTQPRSPRGVLARWTLGAAGVLLAPLVAAVLMNAVFEAVAWHLGEPAFTDAVRIKWDSGHYLSIAERGYELTSCSGVPGQDETEACGNTGWFPGYPYLLRGLRQLTGLPTPRLAVLVSDVLTFVDLALIWNLWLGRRDAAVLLLCAFAPGTYYFIVGFPISMAVGFVLLALWAARENRPWLGLAAGAGAGFTYPSGVWLAMVLGGALAVRRRRQPVAPREWLPVCGPILGFLAVLAVQAAAVGRWDAFFLVQAKYRHSLGNPAVVLWERLQLIWQSVLEWQIGVQSALAALLVIMVIAGAVLRRSADRPGARLLAVYGLVYWLLPLALGAGLSSYRAESLLAPSVPGLPRLAWPVAFGLLAGFIGIWIVMAARFIEGLLV
jgi:hypothetical protein